MNFLSLNRMRAYRSGGRIVLILKLTLPKMEEELAFAECFNSFYLSLADVYVSALKNVHVPEDMLRPAMLTVSFSDITDEYLSKHTRLMRKCREPVVISRSVTLSTSADVCSHEFIDVYDNGRGIFVK